MRDTAVNIINIMPPKRKKAPEAATSPAPRKKSKKEALAAAKEWHDKRQQSGDSTNKVANASAPAPTSNGSKTVAAQKTATSAWASSEVETMPKSSMQSSPLFEEEKSRRGGNAFLQSLREEKRPAADVKEEAASLRPMNGVQHLTTTQSGVVVENESTMNTGTRRKIDFAELILVFLFLALNIVAVMFIYDQQASIHNYQISHAIEVEKLKAGLSKSRGVEAVLWSGIDVLEQTHNVNSSDNVNKVLKDLSEVPALYNIKIEQDVDLQSSDAKRDWLEGIRMKEVEKHLALDDLDEKLVHLGIEGRKEKIRGADE